VRSEQKHRALSYSVDGALDKSHQLGGERPSIVFAEFGQPLLDAERRASGIAEVLARLANEKLRSKPNISAVVFVFRTDSPQLVQSLGAQRIYERPVLTYTLTNDAPSAIKLPEGFRLNSAVRQLQDPLSL
jgi:hypothetical protein